MNPTLIIIGAIEQLIVWTVILPQTGWWFAIFGIAAVWNIITNKAKNSPPLPSA